MVVALEDLIKYGWMLLVLVIPRYLTSTSNRFNKLEKSNKDLYDMVVQTNQQVSITNTKMDTMADSFDRMQSTLQTLDNAITDLKVKQGIHGDRLNREP